MSTLFRKYTWLTLFSIAMGFMESAIVVYLRVIFYPDGFRFHLVEIDPSLAFTEVLREAATVIMLLSIAWLTAKTAAQRLAGFLYCFAIWDICYYIFLKALIGWPESLLTWDILFLIPVPWVGPVIAPVILSVLMILSAAIIEYKQLKGELPGLNRNDWLRFTTGSIVVIASFVWDYFRHIIQSPAFAEATTQPNNAPLFHDFSTYVPESFNWVVFFIGTIVIVYGLWKVGRKGSDQ